MPFSDQIVDQAWLRSVSFCECRQVGHHHDGRCNRVLFKFLRGNLESEWGWEAHSKSGLYTDLADCEIICAGCYVNLS